MESTINEIKNDNIKEDNIFGDLIEYEEYYLIKGKSVYKFIIGKKKTEIIIQYKNYELKLNNKDLSTLTNKNINTIDDSYFFIINAFEENRVIIEDIISGKTISLILTIKKQKDVKMILSYNKKNKDLFTSELNHNYNKMKKDIDNLNNEINLLKNEIFNLKIMIMNTNNENMGGINMNMNNNNNNIMNQIGEMNNNMDMMNQMGEIKLDDYEGLNLVFENADDNETYNIKISPDRYIIEAINRYKIKSGREGEMNFIFNNNYLLPDDKIRGTGLLDLSRILVVRNDEEWTLIFENQEYKETCNIKISREKSLGEAFNLYKLTTRRDETMTFAFNGYEIPDDLKICESGLYNFSKIIIPSKWTLIFENQDDKKTFNIRIDRSETVQEAFNQYKIKSGRSGKMKFVNGGEVINGCLKIKNTYIRNQSKIIVYFS